MIELLLAFTGPDIDYLRSHGPAPSYHICEEMEHDINQAVEFDIITERQANEILLRCLINYSTGPNPHYPDEA